MKHQVFNPYLPSYEYVPDGEPHIFEGRVYVYGSHDRFNGISFCINDYVCWSAPVGDLSDWRYEGVIWRKKQDAKKYRTFLNSMYAPDVCRGTDGRYYLYYFIAYTSRIAVAVCDKPAGSYEFLGYVRYKDGVLLGKKDEPLQFDPGVFVDDDGRIYMYTGFGPVNYPKFLMGGHKATEDGAMGFELEEDMLTVKAGPRYIGAPAKAKGKGTEFEGHEFFEAPSMRKFNGKYYFIYSSFLGHELCYATGDDPMGPFKFGGTLVSNGDIGLNGRVSPETAANFTGNTHGSLIEINGKYYVFYHRQTNRHQFSRQACAEEIFMRPDGGFDQTEVTSCGLNGGPLKGVGEYEARIACNLIAPKGNRFYGVVKGFKGEEPYFTQTGKDREDNPDQYIANIHNGAVIGFKHFDFKGAKGISVKVKGTADGVLAVSRAENGPAIAEISVTPSGEYKDFTAPLNIPDGKSALFFRFDGKGSFDFKAFELT